MSIYEAVGGAFVLFFSCVGIYTVARLVIEGIRNVAMRAGVGEVYIDDAIRALLPKGIEPKQVASLKRWGLMKEWSQRN